MAIAFRSVASAQSGTVNKPTGTAANDVLVAAVVANATIDTVPSGWTQQSLEVVSAINHAIYTKVAGGSEPANYTWAASGGAIIATIAGAYSGCDPASPINGTPTHANAAAASVAVGAITTTLSNTYLVTSFFGYAIGGDGTGLTQPAGQTERNEQNYASINTYFLNFSDEARAATGSTGTRTGTLTGTLGSGAIITGLMLALSPPAGTPATVNAVTMTATGASATPTLKAVANVSAPVATATGQFRVPVVGVFTRVTAATSTATGAMPVPVVTAVRSPTVAAARSTATGAMPVPVVTAVRNPTVAAVPMTATGAMPAPVAIGGFAALVQPPPASATGAALAPTLSAGLSITATTSSASAAFLAPTVGIFVTVQAAVMTATAAMPAPALASTAVITAQPALAAALMPLPFVGVDLRGGRYRGPTARAWTGPFPPDGTSAETPGPRATTRERPGPRSTVEQT